MLEIANVFGMKNVFRFRPPLELLLCEGFFNNLSGLFLSNIILQI